MQIFNTRLFWAIYIICAALFFFYTLFPSEAIKEYLADRVRQTQPNVTVKIGRLKPAFPPGFKLYKVVVAHLGRTIADFENLKISPDILSLFFDTTHLSFKGNSYGGMIEGGVDLVKHSSNNEVLVDAAVRGIQVNQLEILEAFSTHKISGNLEGTLIFKGKLPHQTLEGNLTLTEGQIEFFPPVLNQNVLTFNTIEAEMVLEDNSLTIKRCELEGNQLDADIAGSIKFGNSNLLNLSGTVKPHETLLAKLGIKIPKTLANSNLIDQGLPFKIKGPMESPTYSLLTK